MSPRATYRVQFHAGFTFADALPLVDYWARLGISHLYASPIATARAGSTHGYDVVDPTTINPALGGEEGFRGLAEALQARGLGVILDIVPNHVAVGGQENAWWLDVLERGPASAYAHWFDIDWTSADPALHGKVLAPFLGAPYAQALAAGDLTLDVEAEIGRLSVLAHGAHRFPLRREDYAEVLAAAGVATVEALDPQALARAYDPATDDGRARLHAVMERQHWRLAWWRSAGDAINWRRFFDITELAGLRIEEPAVFEAVHALPLRLYAEGLIDGLRVDHVDGLADPGGYCRRLRTALEACADQRPAGRRDRAYLVVEKILGAGEVLSPDWDVDGTTGYEFMNEVSAVLHAPRGAQPLAAWWSDLTGRTPDFEAEEDIARREMLHRGFAGQLDAVALALHRAGQSAVETRDLALPAFRRAAAALIAAFRVYRTYGTGDAAAPGDRAQLEHAAAAAAEGDAEAVALIAAWLAGEGPGDLALRAEAVRRFQQLSAPIAAKAVEDTAFYRYGRLLSRNDVGFDPGRLAQTAQAFLAVCRARGEAFPHALLTTATHDHKRGEDARARLAVLSEMPEAWIAAAAPWIAEAGRAGVDAADAAMALQTLVGAWPLELATDDAPGLAAFAERVAQWQVKALREAKLRSSWTQPDEAYEATCTGYFTRLLTGADTAGARAGIAALVNRIAAPGAAKALVQTGLRLTLPGAPDLFQGRETWDFSLVDPDNRRLVDYAALQAGLGAPSPDWRAGGVKQALVARLLALRAAEPALFAHGDLEPIPVEGARADAVVAFRRRWKSRSLVVLGLLRTAEACAARPAVAQDWWGDTALRLAPDRTIPAQAFAGEAVFAARLDP